MRSRVHGDVSRFPRRAAEASGENHIVAPCTPKERRQTQLATGRQSAMSDKPPRPFSVTMSVAVGAHSLNFPEGNPSGGEGGGGGAVGGKRRERKRVPARIVPHPGPCLIDLWTGQTVARNPAEKPHSSTGKVIKVQSRFSVPG